MSTSPRADPADCSCGRKLPVGYVNIGVFLGIYVQPVRHRKMDADHAVGSEMK